MTKTALQFIQQGWTQQTYALDALGVRVCSTSHDAVCWCATGAINAAYEAVGENYRARDRLREVVGTNIASWNDNPGRTKQEVIEAFEKAGV